MTEVSETNIKSSSFILITIIFLGFIISYKAALQKMGIRWNSEDNSYCYLIFPLFIYLCWDMRELFRFKEFTWNRFGIIPVILSVLALVVGELGSVETLVYVAIWGCIAGVMFILYGLRTMRLLFPLLILAFIVPLPPFINRMLTFNLKLAASGLSAMMLRSAGVSVLRNGNIIDLGFSQLQVVDACSGLRYFMPLVLMALLFGYIYGRCWWQKIVLLAVVLPLSIAVNGLRIFATGMLHVWGYPELAEDFFHDFSGWLVFMAAAAMLFGVAFLLRKMGPPGKQVSLKDPGGTPRPLKLQVAITVALCLLFAGIGWVLQKLPTIQHLPARSSFESFPMRIGQWAAKRDYLPTEILNELWADDYVSADYQHPGKPNRIHLMIPFYNYQGTRHTAHTPQSCMLGGGWALISSKDHAVNLNPHGRLKIKTMTWEKEGYKLLGSFFFFQRGRVITSPWKNKFYLMWDAFTKRRTDGALVRVEMVTAPGQSVDEAQVVLDGFISKLWPVLPEFVPE